MLTKSKIAKEATNDIMTFLEKMNFYPDFDKHEDAVNYITGRIWRALTKHQVIRRNQETPYD